jgi:uncharacterized protein DUF3551
MRMIILAAASTLVLASSASAQLLSNSPGQFCLRSGAGDASKGMESCNFQSLAQCNAAKGGQSDQCVPNANLKGTPVTTGSAAADSGAAPKQMKSKHASSKHAMKATSSHAMKSTSPAKSTTGSAPKQQQ